MYMSFCYFTRVTLVSLFIEESFLWIEFIYIEFNFILDFTVTIGSMMNWINIWISEIVFKNI